MIEVFREKLTNENLADRIARMVLQLEDAADGRAATPEKVAEKQSRRPRNGPPRVMPPEPPSAEEQAAAAQVKRDLDFSLTPVEGNGPRRPRRERKPSRPLPLL
jgi:ATP-dependent Lhr-like helicase